MKSLSLILPRAEHVSRASAFLLEPGLAFLHERHPSPSAGRRFDQEAGRHDRALGSRVNLLITGASRGLGDALARGLPSAGDTAFLVSRNSPPSLEVRDGVARHWLEADLNDVNAPEITQNALDGHALDVLIHNAGIWESTAFFNGYEFQNVSDTETRGILRVNLESVITLTRALLPHLEGSTNPKIVLIGSVNGLENTGMPEVAYNASKWGLRGVAHGLRENLRQKRIGVTIINPGSIDVTDDSSREDLIPPSDLVTLLRCIVSLSRRSNVKEIDLPAMLDEMV
jgi:NAD(P)-dependent dehydrogenase (short-subunit alcohol dehydrogenase family)